jgi:2-phospho-L-lactate guanylyltransferase
MKVSALIPAKGFTNAKQRLSSLLGAADRAVLAEAMLCDVLRQTLLARGLEATFVVTGEARVREIASSLGAQVICEQEERGETEAVMFALAEMKQRGIQTVLVIPADIPLLRASDIEMLLNHVAEENLTSPFALLVPSRDRMGTNALFLSPPDVIKPGFGYDSFAYHLSEVAAKGLPLRVLENQRIALDIDEPADLECFLAAANRECESYARLIEMEWVAGSPKAQRSGGL